MWNSAVAWRYVTGDIRVELPKGRKLRMRSYTLLEVKCILAHTKGAEQVFSSGWQQKEGCASGNSLHSMLVTLTWKISQWR
jgi:hypothetical protein